MTHTNSPLGQQSAYVSQYQPDLLFPIKREDNRRKMGVPALLPFKGVDIWNAYEVSWLNAKGKPVVAIGEFTVPCESPCLIESKSFKLYLNSFNNTPCDSFAAVQALMQRDLSAAAGLPVQVRLLPLEQTPSKIVTRLEGTLIDELDVVCDTYLPDPTLLQTEPKDVTETLCSDLLKSNCLVTSQPDWGSVQIHYSGKKISHAGLLRYIVSLRNHNEFHEPCVERIFMDITRQCQPKHLSVYARYTRRGGLDINPYRSSGEVKINTDRLARQ